jgi:Putative Actinobacterial Holin-X, holin superfamily III
MADQAALSEHNGPASPVKPAPGVRDAVGHGAAPAAAQAAASQVVSNVAGFGENLLNLAELQARMAAIELRQNVDAMKTAGTVLAIAALFALASFPVVLAGIAELLVSELAWRRGHALLAVGLTTIGIASFVAVASAVWLRRQQFGFPLSAEEFTRNLNWVHTVLRLSGRHPTRRS